MKDELWYMRCQYGGTNDWPVQAVSLKRCMPAVLQLYTVHQLYLLKIVVSLSSGLVSARTTIYYLAATYIWEHCRIVNVH